MQRIVVKIVLSVIILASFFPVVGDDQNLSTKQDGLADSLSSILGFTAQAAEAEEEAEVLKSPPRLTIDQPIFDFGTVAQGSVVDHQFEVSNRGTGPLKIRKISPACGCTAAVLDRDVVEPGQSTIIKTSFDTTGFYGYKVKTVRIYTNDPQQTSAVLTLQGTVQPDVIVQPARVHFGSVRQGVAQRKSFTIKGAQGLDVSIDDIRARSEFLEVTIEPLLSKEQPTSKKTGAKTVQVVLKETAPLGTFKSRIVVKTSSAKNPVINVPVIAQIEGEMQLEPHAISFGLIEAPFSVQPQKSAILSYRGDGEVAINSVKSDNPAIHVDFSPLEAGKKYAITVKISDSASGAVRAKVLIATDHPEEQQQRLTLPVYAIISRERE